MHEYHDATFRRIECEWDSGKVRLSFLLCISPTMAVSIQATGLRNLLCSRRFPWGKSLSVNRLTVTPLADGYKLVVEMQSGDIIEVEASGIEELDGNDGCWP
jgi:hypothetical protein